MITMTDSDAHSGLEQNWQSVQWRLSAVVWAGRQSSSPRLLVKVTRIRGPP